LRRFHDNRWFSVLKHFETSAVTKDASIKLFPLEAYATKPF